MRGLLEICHAVTVAKTGREDEDPAKSAEERAQLGGWAEQMSFPTLHRLWQLLLKGHDGVANAAMPIEACEMALLRVVHAAGLPDPGELARMLREGGTPAKAPLSSESPPSSPPPQPAPEAQAPENFRALIEMLWNEGKPHLAPQLHDYVGLVCSASPEIVLKPVQPMPAHFSRETDATLPERTAVGKEGERTG